MDVTFAVRNTGSRKGAEVPQVYLGPAENSPVPMAPKSFAGFRRIELEPGRSKVVKMHIDARGLSYWSADKHDWLVAHGKRAVYVGSSSRDIRLWDRSFLPRQTVCNASQATSMEELTEPSQ
jgi:beta-glucosidase